MEKEQTEEMSACEGGGEKAAKDENLKKTAPVIWADFEEMTGGAVTT